MELYGRCIALYGLRAKDVGILPLEWKLKRKRRREMKWKLRLKRPYNRVQGVTTTNAGQTNWKSNGKGQWNITWKLGIYGSFPK